MPMPQEEPLSCWVISDGRRGIENQALGLAEALSAAQSLEIESYVLTAGRAFKAATPLMQFALKSKLQDYGLTSPLPDIAIGCGRQAIAALLAIKKTDPSCFTIYVQDPKIDADRFDLVIAPEHDDLSGRNVETMIGSPNRVTRKRIVKETLAFEERLNTLPMPRAAMLIGGPSKRYHFTKGDHENHLAAAQNLLAQNHSLLITTSRRTPNWALEDYEALAENHENVWLYSGDGENPYFAFLGSAEVILITEDSTNMLTEACATGKPVFTLPLSGDAGKFGTLYQALAERCDLKPYAGDPIAPDYPALKETDRIADQVWAHYERRSATLN